MKPITLLFLIFLLVPIAEIYLLIQIGEVIGGGWTVLGVVSTALLGAWLVKLQGVLTLQRAVRNMREGQAPALEIVEGLFLLVAGALLITPGFVTDAIGFLCLTPSLRRNFAGKVLQRIGRAMANRQGDSSSRSSKQTYEGKFKELDK